MKKWIIILLLIIMMPMVVADVCEDIVDPNKDCIMLTPTLECESNCTYTIHTSGGDVIEQGNLSHLSGEIYYFVFNQDTGGYIISLDQDGSTREIYVKIDNMLIIALAVVLGLFILGFAFDGVFLYGAAISALLFGLSLLTGVLSDRIEYIIAMLLIILGIGFMYHNRRKDKENNNADALRRDWIG